MQLVVVGCNFRTSPLDLRERLAFDEAGFIRALDELNSRFGCEAVVLGTCNRVELYLGRPAPGALPDADLVAEFLGELHGVAVERIRPHLYEHRQGEAVRHLFRVISSLDSLIVGEAQIAGQVRRAYERARQANGVGPLLHALFQRALHCCGRVRSETGLTRGHVSISSAAVEYVRQVFEHFDDKTVLVIGAGKMGELTLRHLRHLQPKSIVVTNRHPDKAIELARQCDGVVEPWERLDHAIAAADIVLSTTGAPETIVSLERYRRIQALEPDRSRVILDIAVPRDFDPSIHDGDATCLLNVDDLVRIRERTLADRQRHVAPAEAIVDQERRRFLREWNRRRNAPLIARLTEDLEAKRRKIVAQVLQRFNGKLTNEDKKYLEGAFRLMQNQFLHGPITALTEEARDDGGNDLFHAILKLFRLQE